MSIESYILTASVAVYLLLGGVLVAGRKTSRSKSIPWLMFALAAWTLGDLVLWQGTNWHAVSVGIGISIIAAITAPVIGLIALQEYANKPLGHSVKALLLIGPLSCFALAVSPEWRSLLWTLPTALDYGVRPYPYIRGQWFIYVFLPVAFGSYGAALLQLIRHAIKLHPRARSSLLFITVLTSFPLIASCFRLTGSPLLNNISAAVVFAALSPAAAWLVLRYGALRNEAVSHSALFEQMEDAVLVVDSDEYILGANKAALDLFDSSREDLVGSHLPVRLPVFAGHLKRVAANPERRIECSYNQKHLTLRSNPVKLPGEPRRLQLLICHDITSELKAHAALKRNESLLGSLINHSANPIIQVRGLELDGQMRDFEVTVANPAAARLFESDVDDFVGARIARKLYGAEVSDRQYALQRILPVLREASETGGNHELDLCLSENGARRWYRILVEPVGRDIGLTFIDVSDERRQHAALRSAALNDALTGVMNRRGFEESASSYFSKSQDVDSAALLFVDLNRFKSINDQYGHEIGDQILQQVAARLNETFRSQDIVARYGGDEFVVLVTDTSADQAERLRSRAQNLLATAYTVDQRSLHCSASIGMATYPHDGNTLGDLLHHADMVMYRRKAQYHAYETDEVSVDDTTVIRASG
ncbi:MAG: diguanylate cyclase [Pseudomonadota bacterium]